MNRFGIVAILLAFALVLPASAQERRDVPAFRAYGEPSSATDGARIDALIQEFKDAWGNQDTEALMALHSSDVEWINAYARLFQSRASLGEFLETRLFPAFDPAVSKQEAEGMTLISIRYLGDDAAVVHLYTEGNRGESRVPDEDLRRTHVHLVLAKDDGPWQIVHTVIMDAR